MKKNLHMYMARQSPQNHAVVVVGKGKKEKKSQSTSCWCGVARATQKRESAHEGQRLVGAYLGRRLQSMLREVQQLVQWSEIRLLRRTYCACM